MPGRTRAQCRQHRAAQRQRSSDPENQGLTYEWTLVSRPPGSNATLTNPTTPTPTFVADLPGSYVIRLMVNDGTAGSAPDDVEST